MIGTLAKLQPGVVLTALLLAGSTALAAADAGTAQGTLRPCPAAPHCVASDATDASQHIKPLAIRGDPAAAWAALRAYLTTLPRVVLVNGDAGAGGATNANYLHATATSAILHFVDDFEFVLRADRGEIAMRSASRIGYYDFNVNRARLESVREVLRAKGVVE